jgi:DNA-binding LacI/PurR family transcriptional regulator
MHEKPTSFDIAFLAGVSQPTVSRALRGSPVVSLETRKRIEEIARQLNYRVDKNASNLRSQHSNTLALLLFEDPTPDDSQINPFFLSMLGSITRASARQGYDLLISFQQLSRDCSRITKTAAGRRHDPARLWRLRGIPATTRAAGRTGHSLRALGPVLEDQPGFRWAATTCRGGYEATRHLLDGGRRKIAFLGTATSHYPEFLDRYRGYARALQQVGAPASAALQVDAITTEESGFQAARELRRAAWNSMPSSRPAISSPSARCARCRKRASTCRARWRWWASTTFPPRASPIRR